MKKWYASKAIWLNLVTFITLVFTLFSTADFADLFTPTVVKYFALGVAVLNIFIRVFFTAETVEKSLV